MFKASGPSRFAAAAARWRALALLLPLFALPFCARAQEQQPAQQPPAQQSPAQQPAPASATPDPATPATADPAPAAAQTAAAITEEQLKQMLVGKQFYLRGGYLGDSLSFDEHGRIIGHSAQGSYTLSIVQIDHVRLSKHKLELDGTRYGLHFNEQLAYEDSSTAFDKVRITPKKKVVKITIDREKVVNPKKKKDPAKEKGKATKPSAAPAPDQTAQATGPATEPDPPGEAGQATDSASVTTTTSQAQANELLNKAIDATFAQGLDQRMMAAMPDFWKLYYQAVAAKADYRPTDPAILRQNTVDEKAHLLTSFEPDSNDFAQAAGVAGMALYHTVIGPDGKPGEIAVARPIGFGLDENAVASIRKAKFAPAIKDGKPVPVMLDLVVQFRIFSKRTAVMGSPDAADKSAGPKLPGPYSVPHPTNPPQPSN